MTIQRHSLKSILAATTLFTPLLAAQALAADQIEEIVVTAQKREEKVQTVPIAITAFSADALETRRIVTTQDLTGIAPNLVTGPTTAGSADMTVTMRGLPAYDTLLSNDNPVGLYIDGVLQARLTGTVLDLVELERVEVLRGPQGTLYGRNTTGGAINFITPRPSDEFHVTQKLGYQTYNGFSSRTSVDTGMIGQTGLKASFAFLYKKIGGYYDVRTLPDDQDPGSENVRAFRGALSFDQGGKFRAHYGLYYVAQENGLPVSRLTGLTPTAAAALIPGSYSIGMNIPDVFDLTRQTTDDLELWIHTFTAEYDVSDHLTVKTITGYRHYDDYVHGPDLDGNGDSGPLARVYSAVPFAFVGIQPINLFIAENQREHEQFTQELQLNGQYGDAVAGSSNRFTYTAGAYYFLEHGSERNLQSFFFPSADLVAFGGGGFLLVNPASFNTSTESWAAFGQASYTPPILGDRLRLTGGLRYSADVKFTELLQSTTVFIPTRSQQQSFNNLSFMSKAQYFFTDDVNAYVSYSTGYKAGGFNTRSVNLEPYNEETIEALEIGLKADWFNRRLQTNVAVFHNKARNQQVAQFVAGAGGATNIVTNAGKAHYNGIEIEVRAVPMDGLTFDLSFGYVKPRYDKYLSLDPGNPGAGIIDVHQVAKFPYTPEITASAGLTYDSQPISWLGGGRLQGHVDVVVQSDQSFFPAIVYPSGAEDNPLIKFTNSDARTMLNGRVAVHGIPLGDTAATLEVALWAKNILDEEYVSQGIDFGALGFSQQTFGPPRTGGLEITIKY